MNHQTLRKTQQNTRMNLLRSIQGMQDMAFPKVQFSTPPPPYIIRAFGADSPLVSPVAFCLMFSYRKTPCGDKTNDDTKSE